MRTLISAAAVAALGLAAVSASAAPVTIGFEGVVPSTGAQVPVTPYIESGYTFTSTTSTNTTGIFGKDASNSNGSATFAFCSYVGSCTAGTSVTVTGTSPFSLLSIDVGNWVANDPAGTIDLIGNLAGGGTVLATLAIGGAWTTNALAGFNNLQSVEFRGFGPYAVAFDNLVIDTGGTVPEPASLALVGAALLGAVGAARRKSA